MLRHRLYFDTPPLKGNCPDTLVSQQIPTENTGLYKTWYLPRYHVNKRWRSQMGDVHTIEKIDSRESFAAVIAARSI